MANGDSNRTVVSIVGILAILVLVGLAIYFVSEETNDDAEFEIDLGAAAALDAPAHVMSPFTPAPPLDIDWAA